MEWRKYLILMLGQAIREDAQQERQPLPESAQATIQQDAMAILRGEVTPADK